MTKSYKDKLLTLFDYFDKEVLEYAIYYSSTYGNNPKSLLLAILDKWKMANITNVEDAKSYKVSKTNIINFSREKTPEWLKERNNKEKVNNAEEEDPQLEKDREAFLAQLKKDWAE
jgi:replication protein rep